MNHDILKILSFRISGRFAHFRKFYTNSSSLSYIIPPRTAITGMLASILRSKRDEYYDIFDPRLFKIGVSVCPGSNIKKQMQSVNYLHDTYYKLLASGSGKAKAIHSPCKFELLMSTKKPIGYIIYVGATDEKAKSTFEEIKRKIENGDLGYGVYLGQRQFRADVDQLKTYDGSEISYLESSDYVDTLCMKRCSEPDVNAEADIQLITDQMPLHMQKEETQSKKKKTAAETGRILKSSGQVIYERSGKRMRGRFKNCYRIKDDNVISFFEVM